MSDNDKKLSYEEYIYQELLKTEAQEKRGEATYCTQEEFFAEWDREIDNREEYRKSKKCIS